MRIWSIIDMLNLIVGVLLISRKKNILSNLQFNQSSMRQKIIFTSFLNLPKILARLKVS